MRKKILFAVLAMAFLLSATCICALAGNNKIYDVDALLSAEEESELTVALAAAEDKSGIEFYLYACDSTNQAYVDELDIMAEFSLKSSDNAAVFLVEKIYSVYYYELFTYGDAYDLLSDYECDRILDDTLIYSDIKGGRIASGVLRFAEISSDMLAENLLEKKIKGIVIPILLGILVGGITVGVVSYKYKRKLKSPIYPLSKYARLELTHSSDNYVTSHVTKVRVQSSSSGGRSGGGGGRSGGGSRGRR